MTKDKSISGTNAENGMQYANKLNNMNLIR